MNKSAPKHIDVLESIRRSICLANGDEDMILRETSLAEEFGMSRTPIRQILQRLAYEGLIETRSGVGNVVVALSAENRKQDFLVHKGIVQAALLLDLPSLTITQHSEIAAMKAMVELAADGDADTFYDVRNRLHMVMANQLPDQVLRDAFSASHWRTIRRHMSDFAKGPQAQRVALNELVTHVADYQAMNTKDLFARFMEAEFSNV